MKPEPMQHANALPSNTSPLVKWFDEHGNTATAIVCVAMIGGAIWYSYDRSTTARSQTAWASFSQARSPEDFAEIADRHEGSEVGSWARLSEGERLLDSGMTLMFIDREGGNRDLKKADEAFQKVLSGKSNALARERALWGLAKAIEARSDGDTSKAVAAYNKLLSDFPNSTYKAIAESRIEALKSDSAKEFYAWFHKQNPKPPDTKKPSDGLPPGHPPVGKSDSDDATEGDKSKDEKPKDGDDKEKPEANSDAKKEGTPSDAKSETSKPDEKSDQAKPADRPADDKKPDDQKSESKADETKTTPDKDAPADKK